MKLTKLFFAFLILIFFSQGIFSQELYPGQYLPYSTFDNVLNYKSSQLDFKELRGKLVIIDFWAFYCTSCLKRFNELDSLQNEFNNKIQIVLVNLDKLRETKIFLQTHSKLKIPKQIPFITTDTLLHNFFPHSGVPSYAWIDSTGKVLYKTDESLSREAIEKYLDGKSVNLPKNTTAKFLSSLFKNDFENKIQYATYISRSIDSLNLHLNRDNDNIPYYCRSIEELYQFAYNESDNEGIYKFREPGRTVLYVKDSIKFMYLPKLDYDTWRTNYGYYYQAILPDRLKKEKYKIMQEDLQRYFDLDVKIEKRPVQCLELIRTSSIDKLKSRGGKPQTTAFSIWLAAKDDDPEHPRVRFMRNEPFKNLVEIIKGYGYSEFQTKVVDSTGYTGNIDFQMNEEVLNNLTIEKLRAELKKYDLDLIEKSILMNVLVLREKNN